MFRCPWLVEVLVLPHSWRRLANVECLIKHGCLLPAPCGWTCSRHPPQCLLQGCSSFTRLMSRWGKDQSFPCKQCCPMHLPRKSNPRTLFQLSFPSLQIHLPHHLYELWQHRLLSEPWHLPWFDFTARKLTPLLLHDQGDWREQINNKRMRPCDTAVDFSWMLPSLTLGKVTAWAAAPFAQPQVTS